MNKILLAVIICFTSITLKAQEEKPLRCSTEEMWQEAIKKDPQAAINRQKLWDFVKTFKGPQRRVSQNGSLQYIIPVVFHIMHNYGAENISKDQVLDAVRILNLSFQKLNPDTGDVIPLFQPIFANCEIEFRLANIDPNGNCTDGITRTVTTLTTAADDAIKALDDWPSANYFNIWVVNTIKSGAAGYAYYPGIASNIDGVIIRHDYVGGIGTSNGSNYNERSLTHEVGHYLNLPHTWGSTNTPGLASNCNVDDGISDTPNTIGVDNFTCNTNQNTCGQIDNVQNYMDYASCHKMFTEGQKTVMQAALNSFVGDRANLWDPANLSLTGTEDGHIVQECSPTADFTNKNYRICEGAQIVFKDFSYGANVTSRQWIFNGGTPATDTSASPVITYNTSGNYDVTLIVSGVNGTDTLTRSSFVTVSPLVSSIFTPYAEGFESISIPAGEWEVENRNNNNAWSITNAAAATGVKSIRLFNYTGNLNGSIDAFLTPGINLAGVSAVQLSFKVAYASRSSVDSSTLKVYASNNCGATWLQRYTKLGSALKTVTNTVTSSFVPSSTQWRTETASLASSLFSGKSSVRLKFEFTNDQGNNIYIDDINISGTVGINEAKAEEYEFAAFPNPSSSFINIVLNRQKAESVTLELYDITGRIVYTSIPSERQAGQYQTKIINRGYSGMYILKVKVGDTTFQKQLIFTN